VQIKAVSLADSSQTILKTTTLSNDDGIVMDNQGRFYISVWGTQSIYMLDSAFVDPPLQVITGLSSPADIYYNLSNDTLGVPNSGNSTVKFYNMNYILGNPVEHAVQHDYLKTSANESGVRIEWMFESGSPTTLQIYTITGSLISCEDVVSSGSWVIPRETLGSGIYFARITSSENQISEKFFVD
jgi:hypothetical protein